MVIHSWNSVAYLVLETKKKLKKLHNWDWNGLQPQAIKNPEGLSQKYI